MSASKTESLTPAEIQNILSILKKKREEYEKEIESLSTASSGLSESVIEANYNAKFALLRKLNLRMEEIEKGRFSGICPQCKRKIELEDFKQSPLRNLCIACQIKENGNGKNK